MKIIHINPSPLADRKFYNIDDDRFYYWGMGYLLASRLVNVDSSISNENWRFDRKIKFSLIKELDGVKYRIFPSKKLIFDDVSFAFVFAMFREHKSLNKRNVIIHFHGLHNSLFSFLILLFPKFNFVVSHHGGPNFQYRKTYDAKGLIARLKSTIAEKVDIIALRRTKVVIAQTEYERLYLKSVSPNLLLPNLPVAGIDEYRFPLLERIEARSRLGLPLEKKIVMQVGRSFKNRGVDRFLDLFSQNKKNEELFFITIDSQQSDELYSLVVESGITHIGWVEPQQLYLYLNAADVIIYLPGEDSDLKFAGTSFLPLEALFCGTPVIATTLKHFIDSNIEKFAIIPDEDDNLQNLLHDILQRKIDRNQARGLVQKYYNWDRIIKEHMNLYLRILD